MNSISCKSYEEGRLVAQKLMKKMPEDHAHSPGIRLRTSSNSDLTITKDMKSVNTIIPRENKSSRRRSEISYQFKKEKLEKDLMSLHIYNQMNMRNAKLHQSLPYSMRALDQARLTDDSKTPAFVKPAYFRRSSVPDLKAVKSEVSQKTMHKVLKGGVPRVKSGTYCQTRINGLVAYQTPLQRKEDIIQDLHDTIKSKEEALSFQEDEIRAMTGVHNPELLEQLKACDIKLDVLVGQIDSEEQILKEFHRQRKDNNMDVIKKDRQLVIKLTKQFEDNQLMHDKTMKSFKLKGDTECKDDNIRLSVLEERVECLMEEIKEREEEIVQQKRIYSFKVKENKGKASLNKVEAIKTEETVAFIKETFYSYLTDNSDEAILYMKAIIMSMGYEGEEMQRLVVKFDKKNL